MENKKPSVSFKDFTREQKLVFVSLSLGFISMFCTKTLSSPLFPPEGAKHGVSSSVIGMIFSIGSICSLIASPLFGPLIDAVGPKLSIIGGIFFHGSFMIFFGLLEDVQSKEWFVAGCFITMAIASLGDCAIRMATLTYAAKMFPGNLNFVMIVFQFVFGCLSQGTMETYVAIGEGIALASGGFLYDLGGFKLPFIFFAVIHMLVIPLNLILLPTDVTENELQNDKIEMEKMRKNESENDNSKSSKPNTLTTENSATKNEEEISARVKLRIWHLLVIPRTLMMTVILGINAVCWLFLMTTLEPHLSPLNLTKTEVNMMFLMTSVLYGLTCPIWGWLADRIGKTWFLMSAGIVLSGITYCFLGPLPFLGLENTVWQNIICLAVITIALGAALIPAVEATLLYTVEAGYEDNVATYAVVASLISVVQSSGDAIGSFSGGILMDSFGFPISSAICGAVCFICGVFVFSYFFLCHNKPVPRRKTSDAQAPGESVAPVC